MLKIKHLVCALTLATGLAAASAAMAQTAQAPAEGAEGQPPQGQQAAPMPPPLRCDFKVMHNCSGDSCKKGSDVKGLVLPLKVTVDFESNTVAAVDETGYARPDRIDGVVHTADQLMLHGVDGPFAWQLLIHDNSDAASLAMQTADQSLIAFGNCRK